MSYLFEKVSYLKGLAEGMEISDSTKEGKLLLKIIEVLEDVADTVDELDEEIGEIDEYVEMIDEDLSDLEDEFYDDDDEFDDLEEIICPKCGEDIYVDHDTLCEEGDLQLECPCCGKVFILEDEEKCGCGCGCHGDEDSEDN